MKNNENPTTTKSLLRTIAPERTLEQAQKQMSIMIKLQRYAVEAEADYKGSSYEIEQDRLAELLAVQDAIINALYED